MSWQDKLENTSKMAFFFSGVAVATLISFMFYQPNNELVSQPVAPIGDSMLPPIKAIPASRQQEAEAPKTTSVNLPVQTSEVVDEPPMPGTVDSPPVPKTIEDAPQPESVENPPIPETVTEPTAFASESKNPASP
jgi:hypothetical protein